MSPASVQVLGKSPLYCLFTCFRDDTDGSRPTDLSHIVWLPFASGRLMTRGFKSQIERRQRLRTSAHALSSRSVARNA